MQRVRVGEVLREKWPGHPSPLPRASIHPSLLKHLWFSTFICALEDTQHKHRKMWGVALGVPEAHPHTVWQRVCVGGVWCPYVGGSSEVTQPPQHNVSVVFLIRKYFCGTHFDNSLSFAIHRICLVLFTGKYRLLGRTGQQRKVHQMLESVTPALSADLQPPQPWKSPKNPVMEKYGPSTAQNVQPEKR